jgi:Domain of unknown function (DUF6468)
MLPLMLDGLLLLLLLGVLAVGLRLRVGVRQLRREVGDLERLIGALDAASSRSAAALAGLKRAAESAAEQLTSAQRLLDDLRFLTERGGQIADRLEDGIRGTRAAAAAPSQPATKPGHAGNGTTATLADELQRTLLTLR